MKSKKYDKKLAELDVGLVQMAHWAKVTGQRVLVLFEGRDTAGKGGTINAIHAHINPRDCHIIAFGKPPRVLGTQAYLKRYATRLPDPGEIMLFDRSWYNRAGVERVMGYCSEKQATDFLAAVPEFEKGLVDQGILLFKYWLCCDQKQQEERFAERFADPLKQWKLSPVDLAAREHYDEYTVAREAMLKATHTPFAPWTLVDFNDQKRGRLTLIRNLLDRMPDMRIPVELPAFAELKNDPSKERYALLEPIEPWPAKKA
ncbi:MAG: polyphosphate kinase 2 [Sphingomicrobium sp.]